jgi:hypothetical protein
MKTVLCGLLLSYVVAAQVERTPLSPITYDEAVANEKQLFAADQQHDLATLRSIVADDFVDIAKDGSSTGKEALLRSKVFGETQTPIATGPHVV